MHALPSCRLSVWLALAVIASAGALPACGKDLVPVQMFHGTMPAAVAPLLQSSVTGAADLARVWATCNVKGTPPAIDFKQRVVLLAVRRSSKVSFMRMALDKGDLKTTVAVAPDMPAHHTCTLVLVDGAGIKSVNGVPLGK